MKNYGIMYLGSVDRSNDGKAYAIQRMSDGKFFRGYDFMGSANWTDGMNLGECVEYAEAEQIIHDLEAADEDFEKKVDAIINDPETWNSLKRLLESIGCTDVKIGNIKEEE